MTDALQKSKGDRGQQSYRKQEQLMKLMLNMEKQWHTCRRAGNKVCVSQRERSGQRRESSSSSPVVSMRNRCSLLDTVAHPPVRPISSASTPTVSSHTYIVSGETQALTRDVRLFSPDFYCPFPWPVSCSWVNTWFNQVRLPPLSVCWSLLTPCAGVLAESLS